MTVKGIIVDKNQEVSHYIKEYPGGTYIKEIEIGNEPEIPTAVPHYELEGREELMKLLGKFKNGSPLSKELAGIDEHGERLVMQNSEIYIEKSYRSDAYFSEYDYDEDGYSKATFHGWDSIPAIVSEKTGVPVDTVSTGDGEKLWFGVHVFCHDFAKLKEIK